MKKLNTKDRHPKTAKSPNLNIVQNKSPAQKYHIQEPLTHQEKQMNRTHKSKMKLAIPVALLAEEPSDSERLRMQEDSSATRGTSTAAAATADGTAFSSTTPRGVHSAQPRPCPGALSARLDVPDLSGQGHSSGNTL